MTAKMKEIRNKMKEWQDDMKYRQKNKSKPEKK